MASIATSPNGHRRILFYDVDKSRKALHLGKCSKRDAELVLGRLESLLNTKILGGEIKQDDAVWLAGKGKHLRTKLAVHGLCEAPAEEQVSKSPTLSEFLDDFMKRQGPTRKPGTLAVWRQVIANLKELLPEGIRLNEITAGHAKQFHESLKLKGMATTTIHKRIGFARQFLNDAVDWEFIPKNPFTKVKTVSSSAKSNVEVPREIIQRILPHCDPAWKLIIALSRFGGLRCPSEVLSLRWSDIDWEKSRMSIPEPKVEHHQGRGVRSCPIFPELLPYLRQAREMAAEGEEFVVNKPAYRQAANTGDGWKSANLRTQFIKKLEKAGVSPWNRLFHSMRASRQTELQREYPTHVVCAWLGNSPAIAQKSYLLVTEADFEKAAKAENATEFRGTKTTRADQNSAFRGTKTTLQQQATSTQGKEENTGKTLVKPRFPSVLSAIPSGEDRNRTFGCFGDVSEEFERQGERLVTQEKV